MVRQGQAEVEFQGRYKPDFKDLMDRKYVDAAGKKLLTFQNLLYVLYEGQVYRMFVSNASAAGIPAGGKAPSFKDPQPP